MRPRRACASIVRLSGTLIILTMTLAGGPSPTWAAPTPGFVEDWPGTSLQGWQGGASYSNPGTGGVGGVGDGFLVMSTTGPANLAGYSAGPEYEGDWIAAGIRMIRLSLNDVNTDDSLEVHVMIVSTPASWIYAPGFHPPNHSWSSFAVDLADSANFVRVNGTGSFTLALTTVTRVHIRHDFAPLVQNPDNIQGDVGIDRLELLDQTSPTLKTSWGRLKSIYRR